jgi:hypothetical protein
VAAGSLPIHASLHSSGMATSPRPPARHRAQDPRAPPPPPVLAEGGPLLLLWYLLPRGLAVAALAPAAATADALTRCGAGGWWASGVRGARRLEAARDREGASAAHPPRRRRRRRHPCPRPHACHRVMGAADYLALHPFPVPRLPRRLGRATHGPSQERSRRRCCDRDRVALVGQRAERPGAPWRPVSAVVRARRRGHRPVVPPSWLPRCVGQRRPVHTDLYQHRPRESQRTLATPLYVIADRHQTCDVMIADH